MDEVLKIQGTTVKEVLTEVVRAFERSNCPRVNVYLGGVYSNKTAVFTVDSSVCYYRDEIESFVGHQLSKMEGLIGEPIRLKRVEPSAGW